MTTEQLASEAWRRQAEFARIYGRTGKTATLPVFDMDNITE
jgi:hypothetical protein